MLHLRLAPLTDKTVELRLWSHNEADYTPQTLRLSEIADIVSLARLDYYSPSPRELADTGQALYRWLDKDGSLTARLQSVATDPAFLVFHCENSLGLLPWEILHDGTAFLLQNEYPRWIPVRCAARKRRLPPLRAADRALNVLFMACSPEGGGAELDFEAEEARILKATEKGVALTVEESGYLPELQRLVDSLGKDPVDPQRGWFDVLHLSGHAGHNADGPVFYTESEFGERVESSATDLARALRHRPPLVFLSGCRTGEAPRQEDARSMAESLIRAGFRAVLGWGRPVRDTEASLAASALYGALGRGISLPLALGETWRTLLEENAHDWHLLRLFVSGDPDAFQTELVLPEQQRSNQAASVRVSHADRYLDPATQLIKVPTRENFVGRRRILQRLLHALKRDSTCYGAIIRGMGGLGKSSLCARLDDRLLDTHRSRVLIGSLDAPRFLRTLAKAEKEEAHLQILQHGDTPLRLRLKQYFAACRGNPFLFIFDDFEVNMPKPDRTQSWTIAPLLPEAAEVLDTLLAVLEETRLRHRVLLTCRYRLPERCERLLKDEPLPSMQGNDWKKFIRVTEEQLDAKGETLRKSEDSCWHTQAREIADGNPRLLERLLQVLTQMPGENGARELLDALQAKATEFREDLLAKTLVERQSDDARELLQVLTLFRLPVPFALLEATVKGELWAGRLRELLEPLSALGLVETPITQQDSSQAREHWYKASRILEPLLPQTSQKERAARAATFAYAWWWKSERSVTEERTREILRLAQRGAIASIVCDVGGTLGSRWISAHRYREAQGLYEKATQAIGEDVRLLRGLGRALVPLGEVTEAEDAYRRSLALCPDEEEEEKATTLGNLGQLLVDRGELEEAQECFEQAIPLFKKNGQEREVAVYQGSTADILMARGELDEALRIRQKQELPVYEKLGDVRSLAVTQGKIADILMARGELDEALRIRQKLQLPVYEKLGDVRSLAVTQGKIADILMARGELDEALRIRQKQELPVYEKLGDIDGQLKLLADTQGFVQFPSRHQDVRYFPLRHGQRTHVAELLIDGQFLLLADTQGFVQFPSRHQDVRYFPLRHGQRTHVAELLIDGQFLLLADTQGFVQFPSRHQDVRYFPLRHGQLTHVAELLIDGQFLLLADTQGFVQFPSRHQDVRYLTLRHGQRTHVAELLIDGQFLLLADTQGFVQFPSRHQDVRYLTLRHGQLTHVAELLIDGQLKLLADTQGFVQFPSRHQDVRYLTLRHGQRTHVAELLIDGQFLLLADTQGFVQFPSRHQDVRYFPLRHGQRTHVAELLIDGQFLLLADTQGFVQFPSRHQDVRYFPLRHGQKQELPVYEKLGDVRSLLVCRAKIAIAMLKRGRKEDRPEARAHLQWALQAAERMQIPEAGQIRGILQQMDAE